MKLLRYPLILILFLSFFFGSFSLLGSLFMIFVEGSDWHYQWETAYVPGHDILWSKLLLYAIGSIVVSLVLMKIQGKLEIIDYGNRYNREVQSRVKHWEQEDEQLEALRKRYENGEMSEKEYLIRKSDIRPSARKVYVVNNNND